MTIKNPIYFPVWPYFFLAGLSLIIAATVMIRWMPPVHPHSDGLVKLEGAITSVEVRDDISNTSAGAIWPMLTSVYFTLEGIDGEFRYPFSHPNYFLVRDHTSGFLEVWVNASEIGSGTPMMIWQIQEHSDYNVLHPETSILFETISTQLNRVAASMHRLVTWLIISGGGLIVFGILVRRWNKYRNARPQY